MSAVLAQFGTKNEVTYGTAIAVDRFWETNDPVIIKPDMSTVRSGAMRTGQYGPRSDKYVRVKKGGSTSFTMPVPTKGFGFWLVHMMGTVATVGPTDSNYTHTGTVGSLLGDFLTGQAGQPFNPSGTASPFTGEGGKVVSWELACDVDGYLEFTPTIDFEDVKDATESGLSLATASYPSGATIFAWDKGAITVGGASVEIRDFKCGMNSGQNTGRHFLRGSALKKEPTTDSMREFTWSCVAEFTDLTQYDRFVATTATTNQAAIVATYTGPIIHAGATFPALVVNIPIAGFEDVDIISSGLNGLTQSMSGVGYFDGAISVAYTSTDTTP